MKWIKDNLAHFFSIIGLLLIAYQLYQINEHKRWENYNELNLRYYDWYSNIPKGMDIDTCKPFGSQKEEVKKWTRTYFNLYSEEYWLYLEGLIPEEMWTDRIDNGVTVNFMTYPLLVRGYEYWKSKGSFIHPDGFIDHVDTKIKKDINLKKCKPEDNSIKIEGK